VRRNKGEDNFDELLLAAVIRERRFHFYAPFSELETQRALVYTVPTQRTRVGREAG
jgi:hypothetical protein